MPAKPFASIIDTSSTSPFSSVSSLPWLFSPVSSTSPSSTLPLSPLVPPPLTGPLSLSISVPLTSLLSSTTITLPSFSKPPSDSRSFDLLMVKSKIFSSFSSHVFFNKTSIPIFSFEGLKLIVSFHLRSCSPPSSPTSFIYSIPASFSQLALISMPPSSSVVSSSPLDTSLLATSITFFVLRPTSILFSSPSLVTYVTLYLPGERESSSLPSDVTISSLILVSLRPLYSKGKLALSQPFAVSPNESSFWEPPIDILSFSTLITSDGGFSCFLSPPPQAAAKIDKSNR